VEEEEEKAIEKEKKKKEEKRRRRRKRRRRKKLHKSISLMEKCSITHRCINPLHIMFTSRTGININLLVEVGIPRV